MDALFITKIKAVFKFIQPLDFFVFLFAFLYGNLFLISYSKLNWGICLICCFVSFIEFLNKFLYFYFVKKNYSKKEISKKKIFSYIGILLNTLKRGFLLGFFIEAFKVGS